MQTDDIAAWLTAIWDEDEEAAQDEIKLVAYARQAWLVEYAVTYQWVRHITNGNGSVISSRFAPGASSPTEVLTRIAADRQILTEHTRNAGRCDTCVTDVWVEYGDPVVGHHESYCPTVRYLAVPHASRPGYQEAWRP